MINYYMNVLYFYEAKLKIDIGIMVKNEKNKLEKVLP